MPWPCSTPADAWKAQVANSFFFLGYGLGSGVFGTLSDRLGRKACLFSAATISAVFAAAGSGCTSYWPWLVMRALAGVGASGTGLGAYVLATEAIGARWRGARVEVEVERCHGKGPRNRNLLGTLAHK
jgi:MFS family permease